MFSLKMYYDELEKESKSLEEFLMTLDENIIQCIINSLLKRNIRDIKAFLYDRSSGLENMRAVKEIKQHLLESKVAEGDSSNMKYSFSSLYAELLLKYLAIKYMTEKTSSLLFGKVEFEPKDRIGYEQDIILGFNQLNPHRKELLNLYNDYNNKEYTSKHTTVNGTTSSRFAVYPNTVLKVILNKNRGVAKRSLLSELMVTALLRGVGTEDFMAIKSFYINEEVSGSDLVYAIVAYDKGDLVEAPAGLSCFRSMYTVEEVKNNILNSFEFPKGVHISPQAVAFEPVFIQVSEDVISCINYPFLEIEW